MNRFYRCILTAAALIYAWPAAAQSDNYPNRTVRIVVPFAAGTGIDAISRVISHHLSEAIKQPIVIENKPGGLGTIGTLNAARAAPDGYTLLIAANTTHSAAPTLVKNLSYDPIKDFTPIARLGTLPSMLLVNPDVPIRSMKEMIAYAKANPGKLTYGTGNSTGIVTGATLKRLANIDFLHVPYNATTAAINDAIGGRVMVINTDFSIGMPQNEAGRLRAIAMTSEQRSALMPDLPTIAEAGFPGFDVTAWQGFFAPANTPQPVVERLDKELRKIMLNPEIQARFAKMGFEVKYGGPKEFGEFVNSELVKWTELITAAGLQVK
jgi:tripartite-type tricarboxylate transporter receptor subunit TctC